MNRQADLQLVYPRVTRQHARHECGAGLFGWCAGMAVIWALVLGVWG